MTPVPGRSPSLLDALAAQSRADWASTFGLAEAARDAAVADGATADLGLALLLRAEAASHLGRTDDARAAASEAVEVAIEADLPRLRAGALVRLAWLDLDDGEVDLAEQQAIEAIQAFLEVGELRATLRASEVLAGVGHRRVGDRWPFPDGADLDTRFAVGASPDDRQLVNVGVPLHASGLPVHGARIGAPREHSGWIVWTGPNEEMPYVEVTIGELLRACPEVGPYLTLAVGWRFLLAPGQEDVWYDDLAAAQAIER